VTLTPVAFFRASLALPVVLFALLWLVGPSTLGGFFALALLAGGPPYLPFALVLGARLGMPPRSDRIPRSVLLAPLLFVPVAALAWLIFVLTSGSPIGHPVGLLFAFLPFAAWILVLGYLHVGLVIVLYALLRRAGIVRT